MIIALSSATARYDKFTVVRRTFWSFRTGKIGTRHPPGNLGAFFLHVLSVVFDFLFGGVQALRITCLMLYLGMRLNFSLPLPLGYGYDTQHNV